MAHKRAADERRRAADSAGVAAKPQRAGREYLRPDHVDTAARMKAPAELADVRDVFLRRAGGPSAQHALRDGGARGDARNRERDSWRERQLEQRAAGTHETAGRHKMSEGDSATLASAAAAVNRFANDGSFAARFHEAAADRDVATGGDYASELSGAAGPAGAAAPEAAGEAAGPHASANQTAAAALRARLAGKPPRAAAAQPAPRVHVLPQVDAQVCLLSGPCPSRAGRRVQALSRMAAQ
jgi:hypothetical protein